MQTIGDLSYSWYLWHWPVLVFLLMAGFSWTASLAGILVSLLLSWTTYLLVENPVRFNVALTSSAPSCLLIGLCLTIAGTGGAVILHRMAKSALNSKEQLPYVRARDDLPRIYGDGCHQPFTGEKVPECAYGDPSSHKTIVLFGDSHAAQWFPALESFARENGWRLVSLTKSSCPSVSITPYNSALGRRYDECRRWRSAVFQRIAKEQPRLVVLANDSNSYVHNEEQTSGYDKWREGMRQTLYQLRTSGASVAIIRDTPQPGFDVPTCLSRAAWRNKDVSSSCHFVRIPTVDEEVFASEKKAVEAMDHVSFVDLADLICTGVTCNPFVGGSVAYRDTHHLTAAASTSLTSILVDRVGSLLRDKVANVLPRTPAG